MTSYGVWTDARSIANILDGISNADTSGTAASIALNQAASNQADIAEMKDASDPTSLAGRIAALASFSRAQLDWPAAREAPCRTDLLFARRAEASV